MASDVPFPTPPTRSDGLVVATGVPAEFSTLLHRLNNQLGIILANAELLETRAQADDVRARAGQIVTGAVEAIATASDIRARVKTPSI